MILYKSVPIHLQKNELVKKKKGKKKIHETFIYCNFFTIK